MSRTIAGRKSVGVHTLLGMLLMLQLAACGMMPDRQAANPMLRRVTGQAHAQPVIAATATPPGSVGEELARVGAMVADRPLTFNADYVNAVIAITNHYRAANGCAPLTANPILMGTAQAHSDDMALHHFFAHTSATGLTPAQRMSAAGYQWSIQAENIAAGYGTPQDVMSAWINEVPPNDWHRRNILDCRLRDIGVGYCYLANDSNAIAYHTYWTEDFGTPV